LHDRAADCWRPLLAIADHVSADWPAKAREAALALSADADDDDAATLLLADLRDIFEEEGDPDVLPSATLIDRLVGLDARPWAEWSKGRPLSSAKLARMLAAYGVHSAGNVRTGDRVLKGYRRTAFTEAWGRYLGGPKALHRNKPNKDAPELAFSNRYTDPGCSGLQSVTNPINTERCSAVADREGGDDDAVDF
jgi:hypothetical protein